MRKYLPYGLLILTIIISTLIWDFIKFPYDNNNLINGNYSLNKFNPLNDTARGLFFIFIPLITYIFFQLKFNKNNFILHKIRFLNNSSDYQQNENINFISIIFFLFVFIEFFSLNYLNYVSYLDAHHEGAYLSAPINYLNKKNLWIGTHFDYGLIGNNINIFFYYLFGEITIGINRFGSLCLILLNKILIILLCKKLIINTSEFKNKNLIFSIFCFTSLGLADFNEHVNPIHTRMFVFLIFFLFLIEVLIYKNAKLISFIVGLFSPIAAIFYFDTGAYINTIIIISLIFLIYTKNYINFTYIFSGLIFSWLIFLIFIPGNEIKEFFFQYYFIINISDYLLGIEYPKPFSDGATRHTKALLMIILSGVLLFNYIFYKNINENDSNKIILLFLFISSIVFFKSGLMRSDTPHIKYSSGLYTLLLYYFIIYFFYREIKNNQIFKNLEIFFLKKTNMYIFVFFIIIVLGLKENIKNLNNITNLEKNLYALTKVPDEKFLNTNYIEFINFFRDISKEETCIQQFTDDNAFAYLMKKPTCTQFYVNAHIINGWTENKFIKQLKDSKPKYIIYSSEINWFKKRNNAPKAEEFILNNYSFFKKIHSWEIYKLK